MEEDKEERKAMNWQATVLFDWNMMALRYVYKEHKLLRPLYEKKGTAPAPPAGVVYMCDGRFRMGTGLADSIYGIVSLYTYCKRRGLPFKINFCEPFSLREYLEPNEVAWDIAPDELCYNLTGARPLLLPHGGRFKSTDRDRKMLREANFMMRYLDWNISTSSKREYHIYTNMHAPLAPEVFAAEFHRLFRVAQPLAEAIDANTKKIGERYISVTVRFQNLLGDFFEGDFPTLPPEEQERLIFSVRDKIQWLHACRHPRAKVLVTSDSRTFLDVVDQLDYVYTIPGKMVHMCYTPVHNFSVHLKSFVDLMMLAEADKLYLMVTGDMYRSGFAECAARINNRPYEVINW